MNYRNRSEWERDERQPVHREDVDDERAERTEAPRPRRRPHHRPFSSSMMGFDPNAGASPFGTSWSGAPVGDPALGSAMGGTFGGGYRGSFGDNDFRGHALIHDHPGKEDHRGKGPKGYKRSDERIKEDVCDELTDHSHIDASDIVVEVLDGEVTLTGEVASRFAKRIAEDCIEHLPGVVDVNNRLRIRSASAR